MIHPPTTPTLDGLAHLAVHTYKSGRPITLITYNFDDLIETAIARLDPAVPTLPIFSPDQDLVQDGIRVFHPHGYLPRADQSAGRCGVIFSEDQFHILMSDNAHWANVLQLHAFRHSTCLFVGTSLSDPNVRRLLDHSRRCSSPTHWIVRTRPASVADADWICRLINEEMASLGVQVLGLHGYGEIPVLFERLASTM